MIRVNDLAGRTGGDEFIAFLEKISDETVLKAKTAFLNEQLLISAKKLLGDDMEIPLGTSVGAVFVPDEGRDFQKLCEKADKALYEVKKHGKHGISIFSANQGKKTSMLEGISQMRMILGERNIESGAYFVEFEIFKHIYRFLVRLAESYKFRLILMQFTLPDNFSEEFKETLLKSLRKSDCVTQNGKKFLILLPEVSEKDSEDVRDRILSRLHKNLSTRIEFEQEVIN